MMPALSRQRLHSGISSGTDILSQELPDLLAVGEEEEMVGTQNHCDLGIAAGLIDCPDLLCCILAGNAVVGIAVELTHGKIGPEF